MAAVGGLDYLCHLSSPQRSVPNLNLSFQHERTLLDDTPTLARRLEVCSVLDSSSWTSEIGVASGFQVVDTDAVVVFKADALMQEMERVELCA